MLKEGWYIDRFWRWVSDSIIAGLTACALFIDRKAIDDSVDRLGDATREGGGVAASLQSGRLQWYISVTLGLVAVVLVLLEWK